MSDFEERYQQKHKAISMVKSGIRVGTCLAAAGTSLFGTAGGAVFVLALGFMVAEFLGVWEEMI